MSNICRQTVRYLPLIGLLLTPWSVYADFYKYVDANGKVLFTDKPVSGTYKLVWKKERITVEDSIKWTAKAESKQNSKPFKVHRGVVITKSKAVAVKPRMDFKSISANRRRFSDMIDEIAHKSRLYPSLLHAVVKAESAYDPNAVSRAGAVGLMQLMPSTASRFGVEDSHDPKANLEGGARYLRDLLTRYNNNIKLALAAYNAGEKAVEKYGNEIPPYPETQDYVRKVLTFYKENRKRVALLD
ncbi:MAG: lytic transglycosylase domain-containing protein [Gammaproteobacteria bacterium]